VLDASITLAWCFQDEANPYAEAILESLRAAEAVVPHVWALEVSNALLVGERRGRLGEADSTRFIELLGNLAIRVGSDFGVDAIVPLLGLARQHRLSAYDASYLELAMREGLPLATQDEALKAAAMRSGVPVA